MCAKRLAVLPNLLCSTAVERAGFGVPMMRDNSAGTIMNPN